MVKLSRRLHTVSQFIPVGSILADIGSDHAYLPIYAVKNKIASHAIAGEVAEGPYQSAKASVKEANLEHLIHVRKGDGLSVIHEDDHVSCITIAGMGGALITSILDAGKEKLINVKRLILQPNIAAHIVRKWLIEHNWKLIHEQILEEDGHIYEILVAEKGISDQHYTEKEIFFGPFLLHERSETFRKKWQREYKEWQRIYEKIQSASETTEVRNKKMELEKYMEWYRGIFQ